MGGLDPAYLWGRKGPARAHGTLGSLNKGVAPTFPIARGESIDTPGPARAQSQCSRIRGELEVKYS